MGQRLIINLERKGETVANIYYHWSAYTCASIIESKKIIEAIESGNINYDSTLPEIISAVRTYSVGANIDISEREWLSKSKLGEMPLNLYSCLETMKKFLEGDEKALIQAGMSLNIPDSVEEAYRVILKKNYKEPKLITVLLEKHENLADLSKSLDKTECNSKEKEALLELFKFEFGMNRNDGLISVSPKGIEESFYWEEGRVDINIDDRMIYNTVNFIKDDFEEYSSLEEALEKEAEFPCMIKGEIYDRFWNDENYRKVPKIDIDYIPLYEETTFEQYIEEAQMYLDFYEEGIYEFQVGNCLVEMVE